MTQPMTADALHARHVNALVQLAIEARLFANAMPRVAESGFEPDGRKAKRAARELIDGGLIMDSPVKSERSFVINVEVVLATITPTLPEFKLNDWRRQQIIDGRQSIGYQFHELPHSAQVYILDHVEAYQFFWLGRGSEVTWRPGGERPEGHWGMVLYVSDEAMRTELGNAQRAVKRVALMQQNTSWALEALVNLDEATVKTFIGIGAGSFGRGSDEFGGDPATWTATAARLIERALAKLKAAQLQVEAAHKVGSQIAAYGGWDKLGADLLVKVEAHLDGNNDDEDEE